MPGRAPDGPGARARRKASTACRACSPINGRRDNFTAEDISAVAAAGLKRGTARRIVRQITAVVSRWPEYAEAAGVQPEHERRIQRQLRLSLAAG